MSTLSDALRGRRFPRLDTVLAVARACGADPDHWRDRWARVRAGHDQPEPPEDPATPVSAQLPLDVDVFVGRATELDRVRDHVGSAAVCAISGLGGIGKSALAIHAAHTIKHRFPDGQLYVNLHGATLGLKPVEPSEVLGRWLRALGADPNTVPTDTDEAAAAFRSRLTGKHVLVMCDNAVDAAQVRPLLPAGPGCAALVTSRRALATLDNAMHLHLDELTEPEAITLLDHLAGAGRVAAQPRAAAEVARLCGYLPLAVRIAGAKLAAHPHRSIAVLADLLGDERSRLDELRIADLALTSCLAVSYHDLGNDPAGHEAARMFRLLGLHTGSDLGVDAAAALAGSTPRQARRLLDHLAEAHLIEHTAGERYRFHDLVRIYAADRAAEEPESERDSAVRRMLCWYLHTADAADRVVTPQRPRATLDPPDGTCRPLTFGSYGQALDWFDIERVNLVSATRQAAATGQHAIAWQLPVTMSVYFYLRKPWLNWITTHRLGLAAARRLREPFGEAMVLTGLGIAYYDTRRFGPAIDRLHQARDVWRTLDNRWGEAITLNVLGAAHRELRSFEPAIACFRQAMAIWPEIEQSWGMGVTLHNLGGTYRDLGRHEQAITYFNRAIAVRRAMPDRYGEAWAVHDLGVAYQDLCRHDEAIACFERALAIRREIKDRRGEAQTLCVLGAARQREAGRRPGVPPPRAGDLRGPARSPGRGGPWSTRAGTISYSRVAFSFVTVGTVGTARERRRAAHLGPERRRPLVLDAALAIAVERGPSAVTMTSVAERLGVTKPVVYACYGTRDELLFALLDREERRLLDGVLAALPERPSFDNPKRLLIEGFRALLRTVAERPDSWRIALAAEADPAIAQRLDRGRALVARQVAELMRPALHRWGTADVERKLPVLVEIFMSSGEAAVRTILRDGAHWSTEDLGEFVGTTLFRALRGA